MQRMAGGFLEKGGKGVQGGEVAGGGVELLRQRRLTPTAETRLLPPAVVLSLRCPFQGSAWPESQGDRCLDPGLQRW